MFILHQPWQPTNIRTAMCRFVFCWARCVNLTCILLFCDVDVIVSRFAVIDDNAYRRMMIETVELVTLTFVYDSASVS